MRGPDWEGLWPEPALPSCFRVIREPQYRRSVCVLHGPSQVGAQGSFFPGGRSTQLRSSEVSLSNPNCSSHPEGFAKFKKVLEGCCVSGKLADHCFRPSLTQSYLWMVSCSAISRSSSFIEFCCVRTATPGSAMDRPGRLVSCHRLVYLPGPGVRLVLIHSYMQGWPHLPHIDNRRAL